MAGLQRSSISFRRQGSSGIIWDDKLLSGELNQLMNQKEDPSNVNANTTAITTSFTTSDDGGGKAHPKEQSSLQDQQEVIKELVVKVSTIERSRSNGGGRGFRTGKVSPAIEPPSPKVSVCGFCSAFGKHEKKTRRRAKPAGKRKM